MSAMKEHYSHFSGMEWEGISKGAGYVWVSIPLTQNE